MDNDFIELFKKIPQQQIVAPTNTLAHIFNKDYKENFISDWLAFLFNPELMGTNEPFMALLKLICVFDASEAEDVNILREHTFDDNRRIDFLIETPKYIIGIENKIRSGLQDNQLCDYEKQLLNIADKNHKECIFVLLCPQSNKIYSDKQTDLGEFQLISYEELVAEFKLIHINPFNNLRATLLMEDFITHMEEYIMQSNDNTTLNLEMWNFQNKHTQEIQNLLNNIEASQKQFGNFINEKMSSLTENDDNWIISVHPTANGPYFQLYKQYWKDAQVHFELLKRGSFPPTDLKIALHTHENKRNGKTAELYDLQTKAEQYLKSKYDTDSFAISYESDTDFRESMNKIFDVLDDLMKKYTDEIDKGILPIK